MHLARQEYKAGLKESLGKRGIKALAASVLLPCPLVESKMEKPLPWWRTPAVSKALAVAPCHADDSGLDVTYPWRTLNLYQARWVLRQLLDQIHLLTTHASCGLCPVPSAVSL